MATALLISLCAGLTVLLGAGVVRLSRGARRIEHFSIALAAGSMFALLLFDLGPEVFEGFGDGAALQVVVGLVVGFAGLLALDGVIPDHDRGAGDAPAAGTAPAAGAAPAAGTAAPAGAGNAVHIGLISAVAIVLHNIIEGMAVYSVALSSPQSGALYALAIALHNVPMGMLLFSTLEKSRASTRRAAAFSVTFSTFAGGLLMAALAHAVAEGVMVFFVAAAAGMICYILVMELAPRLARSRPAWVSAAGCAAGFLIVAAASFLG